MKVAAVWGSTGYIGKHLVSSLVADGWSVKLLARNAQEVLVESPSSVSYHHTTFYSSLNDISASLEDTQLLFCCAGSTDLNANADDYVAACKKIMQAAIKAKVGRVILLSSVAVYGTQQSSVVNVDAKVNPASAYARARVDAENALIKLKAQHDIELCIVRIPMVIGVGVTTSALKVLFSTILFGIFIYPGTEQSFLNCIGTQRLMLLLKNLTNCSLGSETRVLQFSDQIKWLDIVRIYNKLTHRKVLIYKLHEGLVKLVLKSFPQGRLHRKIKVLNNITVFQDDSGKFLDDSAVSTKVDIVAYIKSIHSSN